MSTPLIKSVVERNTKDTLSHFRSQSNPDPSTGFPAAQHRSKSAFARAREASRNASNTAASRDQPIPKTKHTYGQDTVSGGNDENKEPRPVDDEESMRKRISEENEARISNMSETEREAERGELLKTLSPDVIDLFKRVKERREASQTKLQPMKVDMQADVSQSATSGTIQDTVLHIHSPSPETPRKQLYVDTMQQSSPSRSSSPKPSSFRSATPKTARKLRFSSSPAEVHVYESQPSSPKRPVALLLPPPAPSETTDSTPSNTSYNASAFLKKLPSTTPSLQSDLPSTSLDGAEAETETEQVDEGSPEYIRRRYFPNAPSANPSLEWMREKHPSNSSDPQSNPTRYDLTGAVLPPDLSVTLPTHLGLHHHAGDQAGYTIDELLTLARSTVPAQRASMLGVVAKVLSRAQSTAVYDEALHRVSMSDLRLRILAVGVEALAERGSVAVQAVDVVWTALVDGIGDASLDEGGMQPLYSKENESDPFGLSSIIPLPPFLRVLAEQLNPTSQTLPHSSLSQILQIVVQIARFPPATTEIIQTVGLLPSILQSFITSVPSPNPTAIRLISLIGRASRANAKFVVDNGMADTFLRFVVTARNNIQLAELPVTGSEYIGSLELVAETLSLYTVLGRYGMYSSTATTLRQSFKDLAELADIIITRMATFQKAQTTSKLMTQYIISWLELLETWIVCATDPHRTSPPHDLLWSYASGLGWIGDVLKFRRKLLYCCDEKDGYLMDILSAVRNTLGAWLEGSKLNGVKGGETEQLHVIEDLLKKSPGMDLDEEVLISTLGRMAELLEVKVTSINLPELIHHANHLSSALALLDSCISPSRSEDYSNSHLALLLFQKSHPMMSQICKQLVKHPVFEDAPHTYDLRPLTLLLVLDTRLQAHMIPNLPDAAGQVTEFLVDAVLTVSRLVPGDEQFALELLSALLSTINAKFVEQKWQWDIPEEFWMEKGFTILFPFLEGAVQPRSFYPTEDGEDDHRTAVATWRPTSRSISEATTLILPPTIRIGMPSHRGLALARDWPFIPLNDLLRSGTSIVLRNLPDDWDKSEIDIVRAVLLLAKVVQELSREAGTPLMGREEVVFGCMKVFMLEHGQGSASSSGNDSSTEVFRDPMISTFMEQLLRPFKVRQSVSSVAPYPAPTLEQVGLSFLGSSSPFYQFYTDFVGLYDSISFGHSTFGSLLLPPLAMHYAIDYRKLLWGDYSHLLRSLTIEASDVIGDNTGDWLLPAETDGEMVGLYVKALGNPRVRLQGFLRWVAVHHVASNIWPDLQVLGDTGARAAGTDREKGSGSQLVAGERPKAQGRATLLAALGNMPLEAIQEVVLYRYSSVGHEGSLAACISQSGEWKVQRMEWVHTWASPVLCDRLRGLLVSV